MRGGVRLLSNRREGNTRVIARHQHILVVDDDCNIRETVAQVLRDEGFLVEAVADGARALQWLCQRSNQVSLVLLDLMMPVMSGQEFLLAKDKQPALADLPVVVMSAGRGWAALGQRPDVVDCLPKPFTLAALLLAVTRLGKGTPPWCGTVAGEGARGAGKSQRAIETG